MIAGSRLNSQQPNYNYHHEEHEEREEHKELQMVCNSQDVGCGIWDVGAANNHDTTTPITTTPNWSSREKFAATFGAILGNQPALSKDFKVSNSPFILSKGHMFGPSLKALSGSGCVSRNKPETPTAIAARANVGTNSRWPPVAFP